MRNEKWIVSGREHHGGTPMAKLSISHFSFLIPHFPVCPLLLSFIIYHLSFSPAGAQPLGRYRADFAVSKTDFADSIDIEWSGEQVYVPVVIDGQQYRFLLDTGAGQSVVFAGSPLANGPTRGGIIAHDATGRSDTVPLVELPPLTLGTLTLTGCQATVQRVGATGLDGILGFDLVNGGLSMQIDVPHLRLVLTDRPVTPGPADISLRYRLNYHVPYIDIVPFGRCRERVLFDTGSTQFFAMNIGRLDDVLESAEMSMKPNKMAGFIDEGRAWGSHVIGHYGAEHYGDVQFFCLEALQLGDYSFTDVHCCTTQGGSHLGAPLLRFGLVTFDARRHRLLFQPADGQQAPFRVGNCQLEIAFVADAEGRPQVGLVWPQGVSYRQGFRQGDIIEQIDQRPVRTLSQFVRWAFERGREYIFTVRSSDGQLRNIPWVRIPE